MLQHELTGAEQRLHTAGAEVDDAQPHQPSGFGRRARLFWQNQGPFLVVAIQFFLIVQLVKYFHIESKTFYRVMSLALGGFLVHHFLPLRFRRPFFALLSVAATIAVLKVAAGVSLVAIGLGLIGICHLRIPFWCRAGLLGAAAVALAWIRAQADPFSALDGMWTILGSMFIFRMMIYLYDLKYGAAPFSPSLAVSYFFMLPNVCFPLFPVVDYKTFATQHFTGNVLRTYQTGIDWMFRGILQLLLYRLVYRYGLLNIADVTDAKDVAEFAVATYLLYLHVSGQFHLIVGLLHLFGLNLPETHHRYLLASSFTDFWRRINIYWKDFIMKLFFYPAFFALRRVGTLRAMALATLGAFVATWALHSWLWFWIRGHFLLSWQDITFWSILALLVLGNVLYEAVTSRSHALSKLQSNWRQRMLVGLKAAGTFTVICALWTMWSCQSLDELQVLSESAARMSWHAAAVIAAGLATIGIAAAFWGGSTRENSRGVADVSAARESFYFWRSALAVGAGAACLLVLPSGLIATPGAVRLLTILRQDQLNGQAMDWQRRGYYEELDMARANQRVWRKVHETPEGWNNWDLLRKRDDFLMGDYVPSTSGKLGGAVATMNRWGMRDREYAQEKPAGTYRILLLGSSHEVGFGVNDDETFEHLLEASLNRQPHGPHGRSFEVLNLSVGSYGMLRKLARLEREGFKFDPDVVMFSVHGDDPRFNLVDLSAALRQNVEIPYDYVDELFKQTRVGSHIGDLSIRHRLKPYAHDICDFTLRRVVDQCRQRNIQPFLLYRPAPVDHAHVEPAKHGTMLRLAEAAGIPVLDLWTAFDHIEDRRSLVVAEWDDHTNAIGHRLLADKLFEQLVPHLVRLTGDHNHNSHEIEADQQPPAQRSQDLE